MDADHPLLKCHYSNCTYMSIVLKCYLWQCITWGYLWEAILSQSIYCCRADIQPNVDYVAFLLQDNLLQLSCYVAIDWQTKRREYVTDTSIPLIATDIGYVTDIFIPRSKMFLAFLYHETICYWHVHTTDIVLLTVYYWQCITDSVLLTLYYWQCITDSVLLTVYYWQYVHTTKRWITEIPIPQGNMWH